jgi:hypothetical protein
VVIRESTSPYLELEITGTVDELRRIAEAFADIKPEQCLRVMADATAVASPYQRCLASLEVNATVGLARVDVAGNTLSVTGSPEMLRVFGSWFEFANDAQSGFHHHHEWSDGNQWITPDSRPLVICVA